MSMVFDTVNLTTAKTNVQRYAFRDGEEIARSMAAKLETVLYIPSIYKEFP